MSERTKVAIACQGGGSHTAFSAGALQRLLPEITREGYDIVGFSGTSGGAVCALLGWYGTVSPDHAPARCAASSGTTSRRTVRPGST